MILLGEDNDNDVELMRIGFQRAKFAANLHHVANGQQCVAILRHQGRYADVPTPELLLLDLNMPRMDGREALAAYMQRCSSHIVKPVNVDQFSQFVRGIGDYWSTLVVLPPKP